MAINQRSNGFKLNTKFRHAVATFKFNFIRYRPDEFVGSIFKLEIVLAVNETLLNKFIVGGNVAKSMSLNVIDDTRSTRAPLIIPGLVTRTY